MITVRHSWMGTWQFMIIFLQLFGVYKNFNNKREGTKKYPMTLQVNAFSKNVYLSGL